jgi:hypothetical protein
MSGNGYHLLYPIDLPNDDESRLIVVGVLKTLARFDSEHVSIDQSVFNAARITKFYGTTGRKGHETESTPHRQSRLVYVPDYLEPGAIPNREVVPLERLQAVAAMAPQPEQATRLQSQPSDNGNRRLDVPRWLRSHGFSFRIKDHPASDGRTVYVLDTCPFNEEHGRTGEVSIMQAENGRLSAICMHDSCQGNGWQQFKHAIGEPGPADYSNYSGYEPPVMRQQPEQGERLDRHVKPVRFSAITSAELAAGDYRLDYLVEWLLVQGQPAVIAGPKKSLKTNICIDLALSLSIGGNFLNEFNVPSPVRVGIMSGESGEATIQETAKRIANSKGWTLENFAGVFWSFTVPQLGNLEHTDALRWFITDNNLDVLIIDPTYLAMAGVGDSAGNLFIVGQLLKSLTDLSAETGVTPILVHHLRKNVANPFQPPELEDIAWAGFQEFVRQWLLIGRRVKYDPDQGGHHELWLNVGSSAGHSGLWAVNIDEGTRQDAGGRLWNVDIIQAAQARAQAAVAKEDAKAERQQQTQQRRQENVLKAFRRHPKGGSKTVIRHSAGMSPQTFQPLLDELMESGHVVEFASPNKRPESWFRLKNDPDK